MDRRAFIKASTLAGGGLLLQVTPPVGALPAQAPGFAGTQKASPGAALNVFVTISPQNDIHVAVVKHEMGQGIATGLAMILAEELDADWEKVKLDFIPATGAKPVKDIGGHGTGGSSSTINAWQLLRQMGATARYLLVEAAARHWNVAPDLVTTDRSTLIHAKTGATLTYGEVAEAASRLPVPEKISPKPSGSYRILGKPLPNKIIPQVVTGRYTYGMDVDFPGLKYAVVVRCPVYRGRVSRFDPASALAVPGVRKVVSTNPIAGPKSPLPYDIRSGVAVVADSFWAAKKGAEQLKIAWDTGALARQSSAGFEASVRQKSLGESQPTGFSGSPDAFADVGCISKLISAEYVYPYQLHAYMEPLNCTAHFQGDRCELWLGTQAPEYLTSQAAAVFNIPEENIRIHLLPSGGGFGRRYYPEAAIEAMHVSRAAGGIPVKLVWTREDDFTSPHAHPYSFNRYQAAIDRDGKLAAWFYKELRTYTWGAAFPYPTELTWIGYQIPNIRFDYQGIEAESLVQSCSWRSVIANGWAFGQECFVDEIAHELKKNPYDFRRELLAEERDAEVGHIYKVSARRLRRVLDLAVSQSDWNRPKVPGKGAGMAVYPYMHGNSYCAQVVEVTVKGGDLSVDRVVCAVDCGRVVNPLLVRNQVEGGILFGLSAALYGGLEIKNGKSQRRNFHENKLVRNAECPSIEVHFVVSEDGPFGVGEISTPVVVPALANAIFDATGKRIRRLPVDLASA